MKKIYIVSIVLLFCLGCENTVDPNGRFIDRLVFYGLLKGNDSIQTAVLYKIFPPSEDGLAPDVDRNIIDEALIRVWEDESNVKIFKLNKGEMDTNIVKLNRYYVEDFRPKPGNTYYLEVNTKDGMEVKSSFTMPKDVQWEFSVSSFEIPLSTSISTIFQDSFQFVFTNYETGMFILTRPWLNYKVKINGEIKEKTYMFPEYYKEENGTKVPVYREPKLSKYYHIPTSLLREAIEEIDKTEPSNALIKFEFLTVETLSYGKELSSYYISNNRLGANFSVTIDKYDYSNIQGGLGLFAGYGFSGVKLKINPTFIQQLNLPKVVLDF